MEKLKEQIELVLKVFKSGELSKANQITKKLIVANPNVAFLYNLLGLIFNEQKMFDEAIKQYEKGLKIDPNFAMIYNNLGLLFFNQKLKNYIEKAKNYYEKSISLDKNITEPHTNLGNLYSELNKYDESIECYKKAIFINPKSPYSYYNLGSLYVTLGNFEEAKKNFIESINLYPNFNIAHRSLSRLIKYTKNSDHFKQLKNIFKNIDDNDTESKIHLSFALAKAYEDTGDFEKSFKFFSEGNFYYRKKINFSINSETKRFDEIKKIFSKNLYNNHLNTGFMDFSPIFIVGMPRSGTTLVEQILSSHSKVYGADEVEFLPDLIKENFFNYSEVINFDSKNFKKIGEDYKIKMKKYSLNSERITDKLPNNFLLIGFIKLILPNSKIINCVRNPKDNILSIFKNHFPAGKINFAYDLNEIVEYYNLYIKLINYWNQLFPNFIYSLSYEKLIENTESEIRNLLYYCNLDWSKDCLNFYNNKRPIKTASDIQARSNIYNTSIDSWKNYEIYLKKYFVNL